MELKSIASKREACWAMFPGSPPCITNPAFILRSDVNKGTAW